MIGIRQIANSMTSLVNPNIPVNILISTGYTIDTGSRKQIPSYGAPVSGYAQLQALDADELKQLDGLNIQGQVKALYLTGHLSGVIRPDSSGGDIVQINGKNWLVVKVLEGWAYWTKVAIVLQGD